MTGAARTYMVRLAAEGPGIRCLKQAAVYQRGGRLLLPAELVSNGESASESESEDSLVYIPDRYTEVIVIEEQIGEEEMEERMGEDERDQEGEEGPAVLANSSFDAAVDALVFEWREVSVVTRETESKALTRGGNFSRVLVLLGLAAANWMVGTGIEWRALGLLAADLASMVRQCSFLARLLSLQAWKVGLLCRLPVRPVPRLRHYILQGGLKPQVSEDIT
jgi:hypothetical protein